MITFDINTDYVEAMRRLFSLRMSVLADVRQAAVPFRELAPRRLCQAEPPDLGR